MKFLLIVMLFLAPSIFAMDRDEIELPMKVLYEPISNLTYPPEAIAHILQQLPFKDQQALTSTCTFLRNFTTHTKILHPIVTLKAKDPIITDFHLSIGMVAGFSTMCGIGILGHEKVVAWFLGISSLAASAISAYTLVKAEKNLKMQLANAQRGILPEEDDEKVASLLHATQVYKNIAQRMASQYITTDALHIDYYDTKQIKPLLEVARTHTIPTISLTLHASAKKPFLLSSLLRDNDHLTNLSIELNGSYADASCIIQPNDFTTTIKNGAHLTHLTLAYLDLTHSMLNAIFKNRSLQNITLNGCATKRSQYDFQVLTKNKTLSSLSMSYFTNHDTGIDRDTIIHICNSSNLSSLKIKSPVLTDDAIIDIYATPRRPAKLYVSNF